MPGTGSQAKGSNASVAVGGGGVGVVGSPMSSPPPNQRQVSSSGLVTQAPPQPPLLSSVNLQAPVAPGFIYLLTVPSHETITSIRAGGNSDSEAIWFQQVRALVQTATKEGVAFTHMVASSSDSVSGPIIALFQQAYRHAGLDAASLFHSSNSSPSPRDMLQELLDSWKSLHSNTTAEDRPGTAQGEGVDSDEEDASTSFETPLVNSDAFRRSINGSSRSGNSSPRILLLAPNVSHRWNEKMHRYLLALDVHAHCGQLNRDHAHSFTSHRTRLPGSLSTDSSNASLPSNTASSASLSLPNSIPPSATSSTTSIISPHDPQVPFDTSVFSLPLTVPSLLEYTLFRSTISDVWPDMTKLQAALELTLESPSLDTPPQLNTTHYPAPPSQTIEGKGMYVCRHTRIFTPVSRHVIHSILLVPGEADVFDEAQQSQEASTLRQSLVRREREMREAKVPEDVVQATLATMTSEAASQRTTLIQQLEQRSIDRLRTLVAELIQLRTITGWGGSKLVVFDSTQAGRETHAMLQKHFPAFVYRPVFMSLLSLQSVLEFLVNRCSSVTQIFVFGATRELSPLALLLLNAKKHPSSTGGVASPAATESTNVQLTRDDVLEYFNRFQLLDVFHANPDVPSEIVQVPNHSQSSNALMAEKIKTSQLSRAINDQYVKLAGLKQ